MDNTTAGAVVDTPAIAEAPDAAIDTPEVTKADEGQAPDPGSELKKLQNALAKENRRIGRLTAEKHQRNREFQQVQEELAKYKQVKPQADQAPREEDFQGNAYEYLKALAKHEGKAAAAQELAEGQKKLSETQANSQQQAWKQERDAHLDGNADVAEAAFSDFTNVITEATDIIQDFSPHVQRAFLESDNGAFALYDLAQTGQLEKLNSMTPYQVAMAVARAEDRALAKSKQKPVTNTPAPLSGSKGTGKAGKSVDSMSGDELLKWVRAK